MFCWNLIDLHYPDRPDEWRAIHDKDFLEELDQRQKSTKKIKQWQRFCIGCLNIREEKDGPPKYVYSN